MKKLQLLIGLPASGKSTYTAEKEKNGAIVLSSDRIRKEFGINTYTKEDNQRVFDILHNRLFEELNKDNFLVIYDATNLSKKRRIILSEIRKKFKDVYIEYVFFKISIEECYIRDKARKDKVGTNVIINLVKSFTGFYEDNRLKLYDNILIIDAATVLATNARVNFKCADKIKQDNVYHTNTIGMHIKQVEKRISETTKSYELRDAALFHDIGKIYVKKFKNRKGEDTINAHFYDHEKISSYIYTVDRLKGKKLYGHEFHREFYIQALIEKHMGEIHTRNNRTLSEYFAKYGYNFIGDLTTLHEADKYRTWYQKIIISIKKKIIGTK